MIVTRGGRRLLTKNIVRSSLNTSATEAVKLLESVSLDSSNSSSSSVSSSSSINISNNVNEEGNGNAIKILQDRNISVLYQDNHIIVCNKPSNLLVQADHKTDDHDTLLGLVKSYIKHEFQKKGNVWLGLVHRIDRPCSGTIVMAKTSKAAGRLSEAFRERTAEKVYVAIVEGDLLKGGFCENYVIPVVGVGKNANEIKVDVKSKGPSNCFAKLSYAPLLSSIKYTNEQGKTIPLTLVQVNLETGRKHQIRAQLANIGFPLFGDFKYGSRNKMKSFSIALHARELSIKHPITQEKVVFVASVPTVWSETFKFSFDDYFRSKSD